MAGVHWGKQIMPERLEKTSTGGQVNQKTKVLPEWLENMNGTVFPP